MTSPSPSSPPHCSRPHSTSTLPRTSATTCPSCSAACTTGPSIRPAFGQKLPTPANRRLAAAHDRLRRAIDHLIRTRRTGLPAEQPDLLSMLLQAQDADSGKTMTDQQVYDELITLLVVGTETAAGGLAWLFHELGRHPAVDRELHEELRTRSGEAPSFEHLGHLPYTRRVVDEALRVRNPGGVTMRRATTEVELAGNRFPPGAEFVFSALVMTSTNHPGSSGRRGPPTVFCGGSVTGCHGSSRCCSGFGSRWGQALPVRLV
ncbi:cytochrome P450 [Streptomyces sioyaensis]|uniref:cytochrome P450 n=1 Tax=Streptomyces sioyaensis TaxID=67364 RepID=UPI00379F9C30